MKRFAITGLALAALAAIGLPGRAEDKGDKKVASPLDFKAKSLDGKEVDLSKYHGKVVLIVNVASKCGNTPQYKNLEALYEKYGKDGLVILGFPANDFGKEPGSDADIAKFCKDTYSVSFDMFSKITVKGDDAAPVYKFLTGKETDPKFAGPITWNFEKFLIGRDGQVVARFSPKTSPEAGEVVKTIEAELKKEAK
jgi:glutathione peroxidase